MTDDSPLVSVVLPTYDRPDLAEGAVENVLEQSYDPVEVVVVDDGSPTPFREAAGPVGDDDRVRILRNETNRGVSDSRNRGVEAADGEYVAFVDDDDRWRAGKLRRQVRALAGGPERCRGSYTGARAVRDGTVVGTIDQPIDGDIYPEILVRFFPFPFTGFVVRRDALSAVGGFDADIDHGEDWDLTIRLAKRYEFVAVDEPLVDRGIREDGASAAPVHHVRSRENVWRKHRADFERHPRIRRRFLRLYRRQRGRLALTEGDRLRAAAQFARNLRRPTSRDAGLFVTALAGPRGYRVARRLRGTVSTAGRPPGG